MYAFWRVDCPLNDKEADDWKLEKTCPREEWCARHPCSFSLFRSARSLAVLELRLNRFRIMSACI